MPALPGKKQIVVGSKVSQAEHEVFERITKTEDRSMSYVLRELAIRGLAAYLQDGKVKATAEEEGVIAQKAHFSRLEPISLDITPGKADLRVNTPLHKSGEIHETSHADQIKPKRRTAGTVRGKK